MDPEELNGELIDQIKWFMSKNKIDKVGYLGEMERNRESWDRYNKQTTYYSMLFWTRVYNYCANPELFD